MIWNASENMTYIRDTIWSKNLKKTPTMQLLTHPLCRWVHPQWDSPSSSLYCTCLRVCAPPSGAHVLQPLHLLRVTSRVSSRHRATVGHRRAWRPAGGRGCPSLAARRAGQRRRTRPLSGECSRSRKCHSCCLLCPFRWRFHLDRWSEPSVQHFQSLLAHRLVLGKQLEAFVTNLNQATAFITRTVWNNQCLYLAQGHNGDFQRSKWH